MSHTLKVSEPGELVALIPHLLGFVAADSVVCLPVGGYGPTARIDHPYEDEDIVEAAELLATTYVRARAGFAVACLTDDREAAEKTASALVHLAGEQVRVGPLLWVDQDAWTDLSTGLTGTVKATDRDRMVAEAINLGKGPPAASRDELRASIAPNPAAVARVTQAFPTALEHTSRVLAEGRVTEESAWIGTTIGDFVRTKTVLDDATAARLLADMAITDLRDTAWLLMSRHDASEHIALWRDLATRVPEEARTPPLTLLAFAHWLAGQGAQAWDALDEVTDPEHYPLATITTALLEHAVNPNLWEANRPEAPIAPACLGIALQRANLSPGHTTPRHHLGPGHSRTPEPPAPDR